VNVEHQGVERNESDGRKEALGREMKERLASLSPDRTRQAAQEASTRLLQLPEVARARTVFTCLSFGDEIDTSGLIERLLSSGRTVYVSRSDLASRRLHLHSYPCELETLRFGLRQPRSGQPELSPEEIDDTIDVAVIVGLAFDPRGYRLGYGQGFFDRFLVDRPFPTIGLAYDLQIVDQLPAESHDLPMSAITTERRTLRSEPNGR